MKTLLQKLLRFFCVPYFSRIVFIASTVAIILRILWRAITKPRRTSYYPLLSALVCYWVSFFATNSIFCLNLKK